MSSPVESMNPFQPPHEVDSSAVPPPTDVDQVRSRVVRIMVDTRPWVRFFSVLGFISVALFLFAMVALLLVASLSRRGIGPFELGASLVYPLMAILYFFASRHLWRYANAITGLAESRRMNDLEDALDSQRAFWAFCGRVMVVVLALYALFLGIALILAVLR